jgi:hypothetical protein
LNLPFVGLEQQSGELTEPMKVLPDRTYELIQKVGPDVIYETPRQKSDAEFWDQVREYINARSLQLTNSRGWQTVRRSMLSEGGVEEEL